MELVISHLFVVAIAPKRHVTQNSSFSNFISDVFKKLQINLKNNGRFPWSEKAVIFSWNCFTEGLVYWLLKIIHWLLQGVKTTSKTVVSWLPGWKNSAASTASACWLVAETPVTLGCCIQTWLTNKWKLNYVLQHNCSSSERWAQPKKMVEVFNHTFPSGFSKEASYNPDA